MQPLLVPVGLGGDYTSYLDDIGIIYAARVMRIIAITWGLAYFEAERFVRVKLTVWGCKSAKFDASGYLP